MQKQQIFGLFLLLAVTAAVIGGDRHQLAKQEAAEESAYQALLDAAPVAELTGEAYSPDGRFQMRTAGKSGTYISGVRLPEKLQIVDTETEAVQWEERGYLWQSVLWSPVNNLVALAYSGRTWTAVKVISTAYWTSWEFVLPDGGSIPEYTFLPDDDWGTWLDADTLLLTVGRGGDAGEQHTYRCSLCMEDGTLTGSSLEQTTELLPVEYDFDHDGEPEQTAVVRGWTPEMGQAAWYELHIKKADGTELWSDSAALQHPGWKSIFARTMEGNDYLLCFYPTMYQGYADYTYEQIFFDQDGNLALSLRDAVSFDLSFNMPGHRFDTVKIAEFFWNLKGCFRDSTLLLSTENGEFQSGISGVELQNYCFGELLALDSREAMERALSLEEQTMKQEQDVAR